MGVALPMLCRSHSGLKKEAGSSRTHHTAVRANPFGLFARTWDCRACKNALVLKRAFSPLLIPTRQKLKHFSSHDAEGPGGEATAVKPHSKSKKGRGLHPLDLQLLPEAVREQQGGKPGTLLVSVQCYGSWTGCLSEPVSHIPALASLRDQKSPGSWYMEGHQETPWAQKKASEVP